MTRILRLAGVALSLGVLSSIGVVALLSGSDTATAAPTWTPLPAKPSASFSPTEVWDVRLDFTPIPGLNSDLDPRFFGVHPSCSTGFDVVFIAVVTCDVGRDITSPVPYGASFYYPGNTVDIVQPDDETRLLESRYNAGTEEALTWPLRIEITGASEGNTVTFSWATGDITTGPGSGDRPVVLKAGNLVSDQVVPVGDVLIDFATGAAV